MKSNLYEETAFLHVERKRFLTKNMTFGFSCRKIYSKFTFCATTIILEPM